MIKLLILNQQAGRSVYLCQRTLMQRDPRVRAEGVRPSGVKP